MPTQYPDLSAQYPDLSALMDATQRIESVAHLKVVVEVVDQLMVNEKKSARIDRHNTKKQVCGSPEGSRRGGGE